MAVQLPSPSATAGDGAPSESSSPSATQPQTVWLNTAWIAGLLVPLALGIWRQAPLLTGTALLGLALTLAYRLWLRFCLTGVSYQRTLGAARAFLGDRVPLTIEVGNDKLLPLSWLVAADRMPDRLQLEGGQLATEPGGWQLFLKELLALMPYARAKLHYTVQCAHRGTYDFGPARLQSGDLLGYATRQAAVPAMDRLLVYPKLFELDLAWTDSKRMIGPQRVDRVILTDPSRTVGVRQYRPGDPLRHVEWRASARGQRLLVRQFEPSTDPAAAIFLNSDLPSLEWDYYDRPELEFCISLAASLAKWMLDRGYPVGLFGNGEPVGQHAVRLAMSNHPEQMQRILQTLALASPFGPVLQRADGPRDRYEPDLEGQRRWRLTLGQLLLREGSRLPYEASLIVITAKIDVDLLAASRELQRKRPLTFYYVRLPGEMAPPNLSGLHLVEVPYDPDWLTRDRLPLAA